MGMMQLQPTWTPNLLIPYNQYNKPDARNFEVEVEFTSNDRGNPMLWENLELRKKAYHLQQRILDPLLGSGNCPSPLAVRLYVSWS